MGRSRHYETALVGLMFLTFGTIFLDRMAQFYLAPYIIPDLHVDNQQIGIMASALALAWALSCVFFGVISDRVGRRSILIPAVFAFSLLSWLSGVVHDHLWLLGALQFVLSASQAITTVVLVLIPTESVPARFAATAIGITTMSAELVGATIAPALGGIVADSYGLAPTLVMGAAANLVLLVAVSFLTETTGKAARAPTAAAGA